MESSPKKIETMENIKALNYAETHAKMFEMRIDGSWLKEDQKDHSDLYNALIKHRAELEKK